MRMSKSSDGSLLFGASEFLTPRQIANFSFRLSAKRVLPTDDEAKDEIQVDLREATEEKNLQDLSRQVLNEVSIPHPIIQCKLPYIALQYREFSRSNYCYCNSSLRLKDLLVDGRNSCE